ncbi:ZW10 interactor isoform X2 [Hyperolius riggenbachi]|uniref:ZW10 interactor isoform X2 n=1 Tax=Hyperolius riggenbachi TaxID=752182 RepID=UPI0035A381DB
MPWLLDSVTHNAGLDLHLKKKGEDEVPAKILLHYTKENCRKRRVLCSQLYVLRFLLEFLQDVNSANWEEDNPELNKEVEPVRQRWIALKSEYQDKVQEVEELLPQLLERIQLLQEKKTQLEETLQRFQQKKALKQDTVKQELQESIQKSQQSVQKCQQQIQLLKAEVDKLEQSADNWIQTVNRDSSHLDLLHSLQGISLVSVGEEDIVLDLNVGEEAQLAPLRIIVHLTSQGQFHIQAGNSMPDLPPDLQRGDICCITAVLLELKCWYQSHGRLLAELRDLQERFALDWLPAERKLFFLRGSVQYTLLVEPGYPHSGGVRLLSVRRSETSVPHDHFKPPAESPSLTVWLEYLRSSPEGAST